MENGTHEEVVAHVGEMISPLTLKIFGAEGHAVVQYLTEEMVQWLRDTAILWVINYGQADLTQEIND